MAKQHLGRLKDNTIGKLYNIFYRKGYGKNGRFIYIGNFSKGNFLRFLPDSDDVYIQSKQMLRYPKSKEDIMELLKMILGPMDCEILELMVKSRQEIADKFLLEDI